MSPSQCPRLSSWIWSLVPARWLFHIVTICTIHSLKFIRFKFFLVFFNILWFQRNHLSLQVRLLGAEQPMSAGRFLRNICSADEKIFDLIRCTWYSWWCWWCWWYLIWLSRNTFRSRELVCEAQGGRPRPTFTWWKVIINPIIITTIIVMITIIIIFIFIITITFTGRSEGRWKKRAQYQWKGYCQVLLFFFTSQIIVLSYLCFLLPSCLLKIYLSQRNMILVLQISWKIQLEYNLLISWQIQLEYNLLISWQIQLEYNLLISWQIHWNITY